MYDRYYKLAVFGDSYADSGPPDSKFYHESYYHRLSEMLAERSPNDERHHPDDETLYYENLGMSGSGPYWSYFNFKKYAIDLNYVIENAVMTFTDTSRLPITNPYYAGTAWKNLFRLDKFPLPMEREINNEGISPSKEHWETVVNEMGLHPQPKLGGYDEADVFSMWNLVFEDNYYGSDLARLISLSSFTKSIEVAKTRNVNLVLIVPFENSLIEYLGEDPNPEITENFMIITGLDKVSHMETKTQSTCADLSHKFRNNSDLVKEVRWKGNHVDVRCNHLCNTNNKILADLIWQGFEGQTGIYDLSEQPGLNFDEIHEYADLIYRD